MPTLPCRRCGGEKGPGKRRHLCDVCRVIAGEVSRERARSNAAQWYTENRERALTRERQRREADPVFAQRNRDRAREWRIANPEQAARLRHRSVLTYRGRRAAAFIEAVDPLIVLERADGVCGICGEDVNPLHFDVDHIVPLSRDGEHSYRNVQAAHPRCNKTKGARVPEEVLA